MWTEYAVMTDQTKTLESAIPITPTIFLFAVVSIFLVGCLVGVIEVFYVYRLFVNQSFPKKIIGKFILYTVVLSILVLILYMLAASIVSNEPVFSKSIWEQYVAFFFSITHISTAIQLLFSLLVSLFYAEISENLGQNILRNFFTGRYHKPVVEKRIFMFVDMKDSTAIAEKLGHEIYFSLLKDYYRSFSNAIIKNRGEVYQYVGDEIVITWPLKKGLEKLQCIQCFFDMKNALEGKQQKFNKRYQIVPNFKAALHFGAVTTGEIGALKKDIFFTGDVLNTTARIISLSSQLGHDFLISETLLKEFDKTIKQQQDLSERFKVTNLGIQSFKGKTNELQVFSIERTNEI